MQFPDTRVHSRGEGWAVRSALLVGLLLTSALGAFAQTTFDYNVQPRTFRACRLLVPYETATGWRVQDSDDRSLIFEGMRRFPGKPAGWEIVNPLAPAATVSSNPALRILPATPRSMLPAGTLGYWEVALDLHPELAPLPAATSPNGTPNPNYSGPQLDQFDLIYVWGGPAGSVINLDLYRPEWRAALQRAVYNGAVLWVDANRNGTAVRNFAPPGPLQSGAEVTPWAARPFDFAAGAQTAGAYRLTARSTTMPYAAADRILNYPFVLRDVSDIPYIGSYPNAIINAWPTPAGQSATVDTLSLNDPSWQTVISVVDGANGYNNAAVLRYGSGAVVVTASDVGYDIVNWWRGAQRNRPVQQEAADCKFAWNVLASAGGAQQAQGNAQAQASSTTVAPPPLGIGWQYPDRYNTDLADANTRLGPVVSSPVENKGLVYAVSLPYTGANPRNAQLMCFDADPARDLDSDGRADDGVVDYSLGRSYDMVWSVDLGANWTPRTAGPCVATIVPPGGAQTDVVLVSVAPSTPVANNYGEVRAYNAHTGVAVWTRRLMAYDTTGGNNGMVVDLSTPVVQGGFVYVLASEWDSDIDVQGGAENSYGRVHAFTANYLWSAANVAGVRWVYPDPTDNPAWDADAANGTEDHATPEIGKSLPAFQDPRWVAGVAPFDPRPEIPPFPTARPVIVQPTGPLADSGVDVLLRCSAPYSIRYVSSDQTDLDASVGGTDFYLIPSPQADPVAPANPVDQLNRYAFRVWLPEATSLANTTVTLAVTRLDDPNIDSSGTGLWQDPADGRIYLYFRSGTMREFLLPSLGNVAPNAAVNGIRDHVTLGQGTRITINYQVNEAGWRAATVTANLRGPVLRASQMPVNQRLVTPGSAWGGGGLYATDTIEDNDGVLCNFDYTFPYTGAPGTIGAREADTGVLRWQYRPTSALNTNMVGTASRAQVAKSGFAVERSEETAFAAVNSIVTPGTVGATGQVPQVLGLDLAPRLQVQLYAPDTPAKPAAGWGIRAGRPLTVRTIGANGTSEVIVPETVLDDAGATQWVYLVEPASRTLTFNPQVAGWVNDTVGSLWGKPLWVDFWRTDPASPNDPGADVQIDDTHNEAQRLHVLPDLLRFQYTPGTVRLQHGVVGAQGAGLATMAAFSLPNGVPLQRVAAVDEPVYTAQLDGLPGTWTGLLSRGLVDVSSVRLPSGEPVLPGTEIIVQYDYWDPITRGAVTARERHQIPVYFGGSLGSPMLADRTLHLGTQGYRPDGARGVGNWLLPPDAVGVAGLNSVRKSFLSVVFDPITRLVRGALAQTAIPVTQYSNGSVVNGTPVVQGTASVDAGGLLVGSNLMTRLPQIASGAGNQTEGSGFVSRLAPERTLICDNTRLVEVVGQKQSWVCAGSLAPAYHEALDVAALGNQELKRTPFSRPAKAVYLSSGNILVADSGNDRVIEIDRQGKQVWPLDTNGYDLHTSVLNLGVDLERPSDCSRYYVEYNAGSIYYTTHGALLPISRPDPADPATWTGTEVHTVIADPGHDRVVDIVTYINYLGVQTHRLDVLTPSTIRLASRTGIGKVSYTRAQPIFDSLATGTHPVIGYLCTAANLHQLVVVERGTRRVNPPSGDTPPGGSRSWAWLAWLYDSNTADANYAADNPLIFRNLRDVQLSMEYPTAFLTVTCGQFAGRLLNLGPNLPPHYLAAQGAGIFEYAINLNAAVLPADRYAAVDADPATAPAIGADDPVWWFTRANYLYSTPATATRRSLTNLQYADTDGGLHWLEMGWNPVSAIRLPTDRRPVNGARQVRHLVTNCAELIQNLNRNNVRSTASDAVGPASLFSNVLVIDSNDTVDAAPDNDTHDLDRRQVIPDPNDADWSDPFNQPAYADRR